ncbi:hypothetical protein IMSAGC014_02213 [Bacteroidaceae bacterium]|nr:hypothetical protein IMSAGC014_02213 [Bacteroidaceae bacterium]
MGIFFRLSNSGLSHMIGCQPFPKSIGYRNLVESNFFVGNRRIIVRKTHVGNIQPPTSIKSFEIIIAETPGNLSCPIRSEIKEDHRISVLDSCNRHAVFDYHRRFYKLICLLPVIGILNPLRTACCRKSFSLGKGIIGKMDSVIIVISIHCIITTCHRCNLTYADFLHLFLKFLCIAFSTCRRGIASI